MSFLAADYGVWYSARQNVGPRERLNPKNARNTLRPEKPFYYRTMDDHCGFCLWSAIHGGARAPQSPQPKRTGTTSARPVCRIATSADVDFVGMARWSTPFSRQKTIHSPSCVNFGVADSVWLWARPRSFRPPQNSHNSPPFLSFADFVHTHSTLPPPPQS
jgi:hypothetical protein